MLKGAVIFQRVWCMPTRWTFEMKPVAMLLEDEVSMDDGPWGDPMAGKNSPAQWTNDIDPTVDTTHHQDALSFLKIWGDNIFAGVLFDPPYSAAMAGGKYANPAGWIKYIHACQDEIARIVRVGGKAISFGWSSNGLGAKRGFKLVRGLLIAHGGSHQHDTIVTVEEKL